VGEPCLRCHYGDEKNIFLRAQKVIDGKSSSYVADAQFFARVLLRVKPTFENLTACQARMTELVEENRLLRVDSEELQEIKEDMAAGMYA
jgi:hypothetical protein